VKFLAPLLLLALSTTTLFAEGFLAQESKQAMSEKKLILLNIGSDQCPYCVRMKRDIFNQETYKKRISRKFIYVEMAHNDTKLPKALNVKHLPTNYILSPKDLSIIDEFAGYMKPNDFLGLIEEVYKQTKK
jgi:thioredoxin-related protein